VQPENDAAFPCIAEPLKGAKVNMLVVIHLMKAALYDEREKR